MTESTKRSDVCLSAGPLDDGPTYLLSRQAYGDALAKDGVPSSRTAKSIAVKLTALSLLKFVEPGAGGASGAGAFAGFAANQSVTHVTVMPGT